MSLVLVRSIGIALKGTMSGTKTRIGESIFMMKVMYSVLKELNGMKLGGTNERR